MITRPAVLYPPTRSDNGGHPVVFLAGPIAGAPDWHKGAIDRLACAATERGVGDFTIACPRPPNWTLAKHSSFAEFEKNEIWEQEHIEKAMRQGVLVFWLAREVVHQYGRAYAQTCRFQLGESLALLYCGGLARFAAIGTAAAPSPRSPIGRSALRIPVEVRL